MLTRFLWLGFAVPAAAFTTIAQSRYGAQIEDIRKLYLGNTWSSPNVSSPHQVLGYTWGKPLDSGSKRGLGGGITWAWDPELCPRILDRFREDIFFVKLITCEQLKAAMGRGFQSWSSNSIEISFTDVTKECEAIGQLNEDCPLAEIWVTANKKEEDARRQLVEEDELNIALGEDGPLALGGGISAALAYPKAVYASDMRFTNGVKAQPPTNFNVVVETTGARLSFNTDLCWYLDSTFCYSFHKMKSMAPDGMNATSVHWVIRGVLLAVFLVALMWTFFSLLNICCFSKHDHKAGMSNICHAYIDALARHSMCGLCLRLALIITPPVFYVQIFLPCWECFDFEAAATHEVGHVLGLSHPDTIGINTLCTGRSYCGSIPGQNGYATYHDIGGRMNNESCLDPWRFVQPGVPEGYMVTKNGHDKAEEGQAGRMLEAGEVRPSIMKALTQHNPSVCLSEDDLEGLNVLYPSCTHSFGTPVCDKVNYNIGWVRLGVWIVAPMMLGMFFLVCVFSHASGQQNKRLDDQIKKRQARSIALTAANSDIDNLTKTQDRLKDELQKQKSSEADRIRMEVERELTKRTKKLLREHRAANGVGHEGEIDDDEYDHIVNNMPHFTHKDSYEHHFKSGTIGHTAEAFSHRAGKAWKGTKGAASKMAHKAVAMEHMVGDRISHRLHVPHFGRRKKKKDFVDADGDGIDDNTGLDKVAHDEHMAKVAEDEEESGSEEEEDEEAAPQQTSTSKAPVRTSRDLERLGGAGFPASEVKVRVDRA